MADTFPDIMGEYISEPERFETGGIQYGGHFDPAMIASGQVTHLYLFLQNTLDVAVTINVQVEIPKTSGLFRGGKPILQVGDVVMRLSLKAAEAGVLTLPVSTTEHAKEGAYPLTFELKVKPSEKGNRVRPAKSTSKLDGKLIDDPIGLNLISTLGATYQEKSVKKAPFVLKITGDAKAAEQVSLSKHNYQTIWTEEQLPLFQQARHALSLRQDKLPNELTAESLYIALYSEGTSKFADAGLPLRIGEAISLAKILTYTCQFFLTSRARRSGLLVPIWERALDANFDTANALQVIRIVGFNHILKLAIAISFGMVGQVMGKQPWSSEERQAVLHHITDNIEVGENTDEDFLYLPLMMGGALVANRLTLDGEDVKHSLALQKKAFEARDDLFSAEEMAQAGKIYQRILNRAIKSTS